MATEEELRDAEIAKIKVDTSLIEEQRRELQRNSRILSRIGQGLGVGIVLSLAGMALFGPIKDTIDAKGELAKIDATIAERKNLNLQQRLEEWQAQLKLQEVKYEKDLTELGEDLIKANSARDTEIERNKELAERERNLAEKYQLLAVKYANSEMLLSEARRAKERASVLEIGIAELKEEAKLGEKKAEEIQKKIDIRPLASFDISIGGNKKLVKLIREPLAEFGFLNIQYYPTCGDVKKNVIGYYEKNDFRMAELLAGVIKPIIPNMATEFFEAPGRTNVLWVCVFEP